MIEQERSAWVSSLQWNGETWSYSWGTFQDVERVCLNESSRAQAFAGRLSLVQRLLKQNDKVVTLADDTSILVFRRIDQLDCVVVDAYPPIADVDRQPATTSTVA